MDSQDHTHFAPDYYRYQADRVAHWNQVARTFNDGKPTGKYYHQRLWEIFRFVVPPDQRVLELGCGTGDLLASLKPSFGLGVDFSQEMIWSAKKKHPELEFCVMDVHELRPDSSFDFIVMSDLINDLWDVESVLNIAAQFSHRRTRLILNCFSRVWELPLTIVEKFGLKKPTMLQNWLTPQDVRNLLRLTGFEIVKHSEEILLPARIPLLSPFANRFLVKFWPLSLAAVTNVMVARPVMKKHDDQKFSVSVIVPARNEAGNIPDIIRRVPHMGAGTEIVFVEGHSKDNTYDVIDQELAQNRELSACLIKQGGTGKGDAVRCGFNRAKGDILMILDADLSVAPEDLCRFFDAMVRNKGDFINGVRLVYPMEKKAMQFINLLGNKAFGAVFSWLLDTPMRDTLCGTKVLWRTDYLAIARSRNYFGDFDPFGDFDLLFGAAKNSLKIIDIPIRYRERNYGSTNIRRWKHGWMLLKMVLFAAGRIKFI